MTRVRSGRLLAALVLAASVLAHPAGAEGPTEPKPGVRLQGLDRVTARISTIDAAIDAPVTFGALQITVRSCMATPPTEPPESAAFLQIDEVVEDQAPRRVFSGWMFASSPSASAMEHPVYDVWVLTCLDEAPAG
ncbi:DUF2155 domain-containing protein [Marinivivus vitaminiproducens]|uniref:DUF2155 domain-containing protein n=1 Tax=Marinivivus vitaminiproducens TaxID=3035935 RepID=UPI00279B509C|nr:DUF2155 domain-containing protein [Geminicoccaceae bacterium SCSIO 64248]